MFSTLFWNSLSASSTSITCFKYRPYSTSFVSRSWSTSLSFSMSAMSSWISFTLSPGLCTTAAAGFWSTGAASVLFTKSCTMIITTTNNNHMNRADILEHQHVDHQ